MESAFSETQCAAELLQQFGGIHFSFDHLLPAFSTIRHSRSCPAALLEFCVILGTLNVASLRYFPGEYHLWRWVFNFQGSVHTKRFFPS